jgi:hypothetical protein
MYGPVNATVSPMSFLGIPGAFQSVCFRDLWCSMVGTGATVPFFNIDVGYGAHHDLITTTASSTFVADTSAVAADVGKCIYNAGAFAGNVDGANSVLITAVVSTPSTGYTISPAATSAVTNSSSLIGNTGWNEDIKFEGITWELCKAGCIYMTGCTDIIIEQCMFWDITPTANIYSFTKSLSGYACSNIQIKGGRAGASGSGFNDIYADSYTANILVDSLGSFGTPPVITAPAGQLTLINNVVAGTNPPQFQAPALAAAGIPGATAGARLVGGTTGGAPVSGTFAAGDVNVDQTGLLWVCTVAGTPGTWVNVSATAGVSLAQVMAAAQSGGMTALGYVGAMASPALANTTSPGTKWTSGAVFGELIFVTPSVGVNGYVTIAPWNGNASLTGTYVALYNSSGTRLGITADLSAQATNGRGIRVAVTGWTATPADGKIYVLYTNATGVSGAGPDFLTAQVGNSGYPEGGIPSTASVMAFNETGPTTMPASLTFGANGIPSGFIAASPQFFQAFLD